MESHGELDLEWRDNLLVLNLMGPFNEEGAIDAFNHLKQSVISKKTNEWMRLEVWNEGTLGSPEVMEGIRQLFSWCVENGCIATAVVVSNRVQKMIAEKELPEDVEVFNDVSDAMEWINKLNF